MSDQRLHDSRNVNILHDGCLSGSSADMNLAAINSLGAAPEYLADEPTMRP